MVVDYLLECLPYRVFACSRGSPFFQTSQQCEPLHLQVGKGKCHIVDTFWQTETGGHVMLPLANVTPTKPGSCSFPFFGIEVLYDSPHSAGQSRGFLQDCSFVFFRFLVLAP